MTDEAGDDFLWSCALNHCTLREDTTWLAPRIYATQNAALFEAKSFDIKSIPGSERNEKEYSFSLNEIRELGILDVIGGECWEASYLLSAYLTSPEFEDAQCLTTLELGAGLGLPSLLLARTKQIKVL